MSTYVSKPVGEYAKDKAVIIVSGEREIVTSAFIICPDTRTDIFGIPLINNKVSRKAYITKAAFYLSWLQLLADGFAENGLQVCCVYSYLCEPH